MMDFKEFVRELREGQWKPVDSLDVQYYPDSSDRIRILGKGNKMMFRLVKRDARIDKNIKARIDLIKKDMKEDKSHVKLEFEKGFNDDDYN